MISQIYTVQNVSFEVSEDVPRTVHNQFRGLSDCTINVNLRASRRRLKPSHT